MYIITGIISPTKSTGVSRECLLSRKICCTWGRNHAIATASCGISLLDRWGILFVDSGGGRLPATTLRSPYHDLQMLCEDSSNAEVSRQ